MDPRIRGRVSARTARCIFVPSASACTGFESDFANTDVTATPVPNDRAAILPLWTDLTFQVPGAGAVFYQTLGAAPARRFVVQWNNAYPQGATSPVTFQAILSEGSNGVLFQYKNVALGPGEPAHNGAHATVGIRNAGSPANNQHLEWSFNAPVLTNESALAFAFTSLPSDTIGPVVIVSAPATLWPPNGKTVVVKVEGKITDSGSGLNVSSARYAVSDEYGLVQPSGPITVANGRYSVNVPLVASRHGQDQNGRTYTIVVRATDKTGNEGSATAIVTVPHDKDDGGKDENDDKDGKDGKRRQRRKDGTDAHAGAERRTGHRERRRRGVREAKPIGCGLDRPRVTRPISRWRWRTSRLRSTAMPSRPASSMAIRTGSRRPHRTI